MNFRIARKIVRRKSSLTNNIKGILIFYKDRRGLVHALGLKKSPRLSKAASVYFQHFNRNKKL